MRRGWRRRAIRADAVRRPAVGAVAARELMSTARGAASAGDRSRRRAGRRQEPAALRAARAPRAGAGLRVLQARCRAYGDVAPVRRLRRRSVRRALDLEPPLRAIRGASSRRIRALDASLEPFLPLFLHLLSVTERVARAAPTPAGRTSPGGPARRARDAVRRPDPHGPRSSSWSKTGTGRTAGRARRSRRDRGDCRGSSRLLFIVTSRRSRPRSTTAGPRHDARPSRAARFRRVGRDHASRARRRHACPTRWRGGSTSAPAAIRSSSNRCARAARTASRDGARRRGASSKADRRALSLPDTVQGVIRARLDNLEPHALEIVRVAVGDSAGSSITRCSPRSCRRTSTCAGDRRARSRRPHPADQRGARDSAIGSRTR